MSRLDLHKQCYKRPIAVRFLSSAIVSILITGCVTSGRPIDWSKVRQISEGTFTRADVLELLGEPDGVTETHKRVMFSYAYAHGDISRFCSECVLVWFDDKGVVQDVAISRSSTDGKNTFVHSGGVDNTYLRSMQHHHMQQTLKQNQQMNQMRQSMKYQHRPPAYQPRIR